MNMPGFTAELSHSQSDMRYHKALEVTENANNVVPQARAASTGGLGDWNRGWWQCWYFGGCIICCSPFWCWYACYGATAQSQLSLSNR